MRVRLSSIRSNALAVWCVCGHSQTVEIAPILGRLGDMTVREAVDRMRCSRCRARGAIQHVRICYVGQSAVAMQGAAQGRNAP